MLHFGSHVASLSGWSRHCTRYKTFTDRFRFLLKVASSFWAIIFSAGRHSDGESRTRFDAHFAFEVA
jgi:hypothetical protein